MWEGSWHGWTWLKFAGKTHLRGGGRGVHLCIWGDNIFYILSLHKKLSTDLSGFHHLGLIQGCSKSETHRKSGRLAGTWKVFKGDGGWEHPGGDGLVSAACGGGSTFPRLQASLSGFYLHAKWISQLFPPRLLPGRWEQMCPTVEMLTS